MREARKARLGPGSAEGRVGRGGSGGEGYFRRLTGSLGGMSAVEGMSLLVSDESALGEVEGMSLLVSDESVSGEVEGYVVIGFV
jgi:hypothetical protein